MKMYEKIEYYRMISNPRTGFFFEERKLKVRIILIQITLRID